MYELQFHKPYIAIHTKSEENTIPKYLFINILLLSNNKFTKIHRKSKQSTTW